MRSHPRLIAVCPVIEERPHVTAIKGRISFEDFVADVAQGMARAGEPQDDWGPLTKALAAALQGERA